MLNYILVKKLMREKHITQMDLINRLYDLGIVIELDAIKSWFRKNDKTRNNPKILTIQALATILEVSIEELIGKEADITKPNPTKTDPQNNLTLSPKFQSKTMLKFINLFNEYGNEKMILPVIEKLEKMKEIAES